MADNTQDALPPLPPPDIKTYDKQYGFVPVGYSVDQMHAYARAALAQPAQPVMSNSRIILAAKKCVAWLDHANCVLPTDETGSMRADMNELRALLSAAPAAPLQTMQDEWPTNSMIEAGRKAAMSHGPLLGNAQSLLHIFREMFAAALSAQNLDSHALNTNAVDSQNQPEVSINAQAAQPEQQGSPQVEQSKCQQQLRREGKAYPRTCMICKLGPCRFAQAKQGGEQ